MGDTSESATVVESKLWWAILVTDRREAGGQEGGEQSNFLMDFAFAAAGGRGRGVKGGRGRRYTEE